MRGWQNLKNYFQRLWRAEIEATKNAVESSAASSVGGYRSRTAADWGRIEKNASRRFVKPLSEEEAYRLILDRIRNGTPSRNPQESDLTGRLTPAPTSGADDYGGGVPRNQQGAEASTDWILSGQFKTVPGSSNVYAIAYDLQKGSLFVQYKHWDPGMPFGSQHGPGPVYEYKGVSVAEAHALFRTSDVTQWLWDNVRVRGTWGGHKKPYRLVAISQSYLPRKATLSNDGREWFIRRFLTSAGGSAIASQLPDAPAPPMGMDGKPLWSHYWRPNRATPNRGKPNTGRP